MKKRLCQSCSMPLNGENNGTEYGGGLSQKYCELCYAEGHFLDPDITVEQMEDVVYDVLHQEKHWPRFLARSATHRIPELERWRQKTPV